jgi:hypothetical protein
LRFAREPPPEPPNRYEANSGTLEVWEASHVPGVYLKSGTAYVAMKEAAYASEEELQALIADHPEILTDEERGQSPLLLVRREAPVADLENGGGRWSLDHLYVDAEAIPTLVEVKRSSDTRARREVVAQMLDYAASTRTSFTGEVMSAWVDANAEAKGATGPEELLKTLGVEDAEAFWQEVARNLEAQRFRLIFVSDSIPRELRKIIEFLNDQMTQTDVRAIEIKQYVDDRREHQTVVPRVIGNTETAKRTKSAASKAMTRQTLLAELSEHGPADVAAAEALLEWAESHPKLNVRWNRAGDIGLVTGGSGLLRIWAEGTLEVKAWTLRQLDPAWDDDGRVDELMTQLEKIDGVVLKGRRLQWPRTPLAPLADPSKHAELVAVMQDVIDGLS